MSRPEGSARHFYRPTEGHGLRRSPFNALVAPRPIGWISTLSAEGVPNLAPYSFSTAFNYEPPIIGVSSVGSQDSLANAEARSEFCWNLVSKDLVEAMNQTSASVGSEVDEFDLAGLEPAPSRVVAAPHIARVGPSAYDALAPERRFDLRRPGA